MSSKSEYVYCADVAAHFGVNRSTVWRWIRKGDFPKPRPLGYGVSKFYWPDVRAWEERQKASAA